MNEYIIKCDYNCPAKKLIRCKDCIHADSPARADSLDTDEEVYCTIFGRLRMIDWYCANGRAKDD